MNSAIRLLVSVVFKEASYWDMRQPILPCIPVRMQRPTAAREALGFSPLMEARRTDTSSVEGVPFVSACAKPIVLLAGRPTAERAADARRF
jgi:hypothetical protein